MNRMSKSKWRLVTRLMLGDAMQCENAMGKGRKAKRTMRNARDEGLAERRREGQLKLE
jgi:hypothetical protein